MLMESSIETLVGEVLLHSQMQETMYQLCDVAGKRWIGTAAERMAGDYLLATMERYGMADVHAETFHVKAWRRGLFTMAIEAPFKRVLTAFALPNCGSHDVSGEIAFTDFDTPEEWDTLKNAVKGKIAVCRGGASKGFVRFALSRDDKVRLVLAAGAIGFVWGGTHDGQLPGTGSVSPALGEQLPCVAISKEDSELLARSCEHGVVRVRICTKNTFERTEARNLVGEIPGRDDSDSVLLLTAHYDGHDITDAAHDNAAGCAVMLEVARALIAHDVMPFSSIRVVIFTAEEIGLIGSSVYVRDHERELDTIRFVLNGDGIAYLPSRQYIHVPLGGEIVSYLNELFRSHGSDVKVEHAVRLNWDHAPFALKGIPCGSITVWQDRCMHAHWGHTAADTPDKLSDLELRRTAINALIIAYDVGMREVWAFGRLSDVEVRSVLLTGASERQIEHRMCGWEERHGAYRAPEERDAESTRASRKQDRGM